MASTIVKRPPRRSAPALPSGEVLLDPPPEIPPPGGKAWGRLLMVLPMAAGAAAMGLMMGMQRGGPITYVVGALYGVSILGMIGMMASQQSGPGKKEMVEARRQYMRRLSQLRAQIRATIRAQREAIHYRHPDPDKLWSTVGSGRLWERRRGDADFGVVRIGLGPQEVATPLVPPQTRPVDELEPLCAMALRKFVSTYSVVPDLPVAIAVRDFSHVYLRGPEAATRDLVRSLLAQMAAFHAPDDLLIGLCVPDANRAQWEWAKWLPHAQHPSKLDAVGPVRLFATAVTALEAMLDDVLANRPRFDPSTARQSPGPHVVVLIDGVPTAGSDHLMTEGGVQGVTILDLSTPPPRLLDESSVVLDIAEDGTVGGTTMDGSTQVGRADALTPAQAEVLARELAPLRLSVSSYADQPSVVADLGLADLLGIDDPQEFDLAQLWASRPNRDRLRVPIGVGVEGRPIELDLKESAQDGMGPHGLLIGATGSGKSELLRTLVLALAATHSSEILNLVLVDFKGGATFTALDRLPHTSAVITNLADELSLVDRMLGAIQGELTRRQELLRRAGNYASQRDYERARAAGVPLAPLPSLLMIVDEFSELLTARPDFIDMFVQIGRVGRSLGIHLLLASQRLEEGRLRGLETHLSYRLSLRTFSSMESRAVLGVADAYELPRSPGHGYLKAGTEGLVRFKAAYVSGVVRRDGQLPVVGGRTIDPVREYTTRFLPVPHDDRPADAPEEVEETVVGDTLLDVLVRRMEGQGPPAHQVWLPPLDESPTLDQLLPQIWPTAERGLTVNDDALHGAVRGMVGLIDKPFEQRRDPMWLDLSGAAGNVMVVGAQQSGKSNLLRTLVLSLALTHTPREAQIYCLDFGGGTFSALADLPHLGGLATRRDVNKVRRTIAELYGLMQARESLFASRGVEGIAAYRRAKRDGHFTEDPFGDLFLVVDGWPTLRGEYEDLEPLVTELANRGLGYGIHILASSNRWTDVRAAVRDMFGTKIELRLGETNDSLINRRAAVNVPEGHGHGLTPDALHFLTGLPRIDGQQRVDDLADAVADLVKRVQAGWTRAGAPPVRLLPDELRLDTLPAPTRGRIPIGIAEIDLQPVFLDFDAEPHAILFGDIEAGKSSFLRSLARSLAASYQPNEARIMLVDFRRSLLGVVPEENTLGYGTSPQVTADLIKQVATVMKERLPGAGVTADQLRDRSWWKGPELYVLVDDYDLVAGAAVNPLAPLMEFLPQARDIGLHVVLTRRIGGASRAMFDPFIARIRELASPALMMSGPKEEGPLFGNMKPQLLPPGRSWLFTRREGGRLIQLAWTEPPH
ncbi:type VII secretion protein EccCa [Polymorphospora rubra]|uniref:Type VII secretion protein EccC n=1 Tax=Polymorphospora rubra TaxID=338584 RepID=A0A810N865_9ACTN|nr:type VII secretion protein EccCa [Polymorphospora rubra]BCJ68654.1 type VII secretion protein EccC [Polymorphospora rubra]